MVILEKGDTDKFQAVFKHLKHRDDLCVRMQEYGNQVISRVLFHGRSTGFNVSFGGSFPRP